MGINKKNIKILLNKETSCDYHRIYLPFKELGYNFDNNLIVQDCDLLIFNRLPSFSNEILFSLKKKHGFKYIVDLDDHWILNQEHYLYKHYSNSNTSHKIIEVIRNADAVIVTTSVLADEARKINKSVYIIPNALPIGKDQFTHSLKNNNYFSRFVYAGGVSHLDDVKLISNALYKTRVDFTLAGYNPDHEQSELMRKSLPSNTYLLQQKNLSNYMECYDYMDVSLAPLVDNAFNVGKSNLKTLESGCKKIPIIASKTLPYYNDVDKTFIDYAENNSDWIQLLTYYKNNKNYALNKGEKLHEHVKKNYNLSIINGLRMELINSLI